MGAFSKERQEYHRERIRAVLIVRPKATNEEIKKVLEESGEAPLVLERHYIAKQAKKIIAERTTRLANANQHQRIAFMQDKKERIDAALWAEATKETNTGGERIRALVQLFQQELDMLQAEMDAGVYERHLGVLKREVAPLTPEQRARILEAMIKWGIIKPRKVENDQPTKNYPALTN